MPSPFTLVISADVVAWYAAIVATASVAFTAYSIWRDRSRVFVEGRAGYVVPKANPGVYDPQKTYTVVSVVNRGRRPCTIDKVGLKMRGKGKHVMSGDALIHGARELGEGKSSNWMLDQSDLALDEVEYVWAFDQTGREYRGKFRK
jgi:hypothetical protein